MERAARGRRVDPRRRRPHRREHPVREGGVALRVLGISGSLRRGSHNTQLLRTAGQLLPRHAELELVPADLLKAIPPFDEDDEAAPAAAVVELRELVEGADAVLVATPEYNSSLPGQLKNALDWLSRPVGTNPLRNKPVTVVGASTGLFGAVWAQQEARKVLAAIGARVVGDPLPVPRAQDGLAPDTEAALVALLDELVATAESRALAA